MARNPPPRPAKPPESKTPQYFIAYTFTPSDSAAIGDSPVLRKRNPNDVFQRMK